MVPWTGFCYAALAALGHSGIDATRKLASQKLTPTELVALVGVLDALFLTTIVLSFNLTPGFRFITWPLFRILVLSSAVKILGGVMYQRALQVSPLSVTVPYLAFVPALILITGFFLLNEAPSPQGIAGVCVVTFGGYLLAINTSKQAGRVSRGQSGQALLSRDSSGGKSTMKRERERGSNSSLDVDQDMGFGPDLVLGVGTPSSQSLPGGGVISSSGVSGGSGTLAVTGSIPGAGGGGGVGGILLKSPRPSRTRAPSLPASRSSDGEDGSMWDPQKGWGSRARFGLGQGIGLIESRSSGVDRIEEIGEGEGVASPLSPLGLDSRPARLAADAIVRMKEDGAPPLAQSYSDEKGLGSLEGLPFRTLALTALAYARAAWNYLRDRLRAVGLEEGTLLMLCCVVCLSLTNGIDKMGIQASPSVLVFAWLQRLFMGLPPAIYLFFASPASFHHLYKHFLILSAVSCFEIMAIIFYLKSIEWLLVSYAVAAKRINILVSVLVGHFIFKENVWKRLPYILIMMVGMFLVIFAPK